MKTKSVSGLNNTNWRSVDKSGRGAHNNRAAEEERKLEENQRVEEEKHRREAQRSEEERRLAVRRQKEEHRREQERKQAKQRRLAVQWRAKEEKRQEKKANVRANTDGLNNNLKESLHMLNHPDWQPNGGSMKSIVRLGSRHNQRFHRYDYSKTSP